MELRMVYLVVAVLAAVASTALTRFRAHPSEPANSVVSHVIWPLTILVACLPFLVHDDPSTEALALSAAVNIGLVAIHLWETAHRRSRGTR